MSVLVRISDGALSTQRLPHGLSPAPAIEQVGATLVFEGIVRANEQGRAIRALSYEVYEPMATNALTELANFLIDVTWTKLAGHNIASPQFVQPARPMSAVGG